MMLNRLQHEITATATESPEAQERARLVDLQLDAALAHAEPPVQQAIARALDALKQSPPDIGTAVQIRKHVQGIVDGSATVLFLIAGAVVPVAVILVLAARQVFSNDLLDTFRFSLWSVERVALLGAFGGLVSILLRIPDFAQLRGTQATVQLVAGLFRPIVGAAFALFVYFVLQSGLVSTAFSTSADAVVSTSFYFAVCFLAGFSERLAPTIASRAEGVLGGAPPAASA